MQRLLDARYQYHWNPLAGSLAGQAQALGLDPQPAVIATVTGLAFQPPAAAIAGEPETPAFTPNPPSIRIPPQLQPGLHALGLQTAVIQRPPLPSRLESLRRRWIRARIRRELGAGRPVTAFRAGVDLAGPTWGLIIGFDDERASWYRDGPLTEQAGPWLAEADWTGAPELCAILARLRRPPDPDAQSAAAAQAQSAAAPQAAETLQRWIAVFESEAEIDPQGHAQAAQTLAAGWGEAAEFWRRANTPGPQAAQAQTAALTLSRYATLFPYPMGGAPNNPTLRNTAAAILHQTIEILQ